MQKEYVDDPNTRLIASKIVELAQRGVRDSAMSPPTAEQLPHDWLSGTIHIAIT